VEVTSEGTQRLADADALPVPFCACQVARNLCWTKVVERKVFAVWQKPMNHECLSKARVEQRQGARELAGAEEESAQPIPLCTIGSDPDVAW